MEESLLMRYFSVILLTLILAACQNIEPRQQQDELTKPVKTHTKQNSQKAKVLPSITDDNPIEATTAEENLNEPIAAPVVSSLWPRFQAGLQLDYTGQANVQQSINWYMKNRKVLEDSQLRARYFLFFIMDELEKQDIPFDVALIPIIESQYNPFASGGQPVGLWQFMPATGRRFNLYKNAWYDGRKDPVESTKAVANYFRYLMNMFDNDILLSLAAYNSGEGTVQNAINKNRRQGKPTDYWHLDLPAVTRAYIPKMIALAEILKYPEKYQLSLVNIDDQPYFEPIKIPNRMSLTQVASALNISGDELYYLNAGLNRNARPDRSQYLINVPVNKTENAFRLLANVPQLASTNTQKHLISSGESLGTIARKYHITVQQLKEWNHLTSDNIITGKTLVIATSPSTDSGQKTTSTGPSNNTHNTGIVRHKVKIGESLWKIAQIYKVKISALAQWNKKTMDSPLKIGETLLIYTNH